MARDVTEAQIRRAIAQVEAGARVDDVCRKLGISKPTFYRRKRALGDKGRSKAARYNMSDLRRVTGLSRRSISEYVARGLMPGPIGFGSAARYGDEHVRRLQLLILLKRAGVSMDGMPPILAKLTPKKEEELVRSAGRLVWRSGQIREWLEKQGPRLPS